MLRTLKRKMEKKVNSRQHTGIISRGACAFVAIVTLIGFNTLSTGCAGQKTKPTPTPVPLTPEGPASYDFPQLPPGVQANLSRLQGANPRFSQVAGPFVVEGKAHYYQVVRYNVAENKSASGGEYAGPRPNWADATTLANNSRYTVGGVELRGHPVSITSLEERDFIASKFSSVAMDKIDFTNGSNADAGLRSPIRGLALGATLNLVATFPAVKRINWLTRESAVYENWARNRSNVPQAPGGDNSEPYLQINSDGSVDNISNLDGWNDYNGDINISPVAGPNEYQTTGYLVEFE
jgi:hypothetical protein